MEMTIKYPKGHMTINLEKFFPTSQAYIKKLLVIIDKDWEHKEEHLQAITLWLEEEKNQCEQRVKEYANKYMDAKTKVYEAEPKVQRMKEYLDSVAAWKKEPEYKKFKEKFKAVEKEYKKLKEYERSYNSSFKSYSTRKEKLQKNIEIMKGYCKEAV